MGIKGGVEYVKARGNSTFGDTDKKSYQIKLYRKKALLGMEKEKKWILLANAIDDSLIRNKLIYDFAEKYTDVPSIDGRYVDLYLNGDYVGNYFLCEKVEVSKNRLDITNLEDENRALNSADSLKNGIQYVSDDGSIRAIAGLRNPKDITGGYLVEKDTEDQFSQARCAFRTEAGQYYCVISPENATVEQVEYICGLFNEMERAIEQPDGINPETGKHFSEYMDVESWVQKYIMDEVFADPDTPATSTYFYKDADRVDSRLHAGPMWDYDRAFGGYFVNRSFIDDPLQVGYRGAYARSLLKHEDVMDQVVKTYQELILPYVDKELSWQIASCQGSISKSAEMDRLRWQKVSGYLAGLEANGDYLRSFMERKVEYLNEIWLEGAEYHSVAFLDYEGRVCDVYRVRHGEYLPIVPEIACYAAVFNGWYSAYNGKPLDIRKPVLEDTTYQSAWIDLDILLQNGLGMAEMELQEVDVDMLENFVKLVRERQEKGFE